MDVETMYTFWEPIYDMIEDAVYESIIALYARYGNQIDVKTIYNEATTKDQYNNIIKKA